MILGKDSLTMMINERAPVAATGEIVIAATPELVWDVMANIASWPSWNPDVKSVSSGGLVAEGTQFRWKSGPGTITSTLRRVERPRQLAWTGSTLGINAIHVWRLEAEGSSTLVRTEESWEGILPRLFRSQMQKVLHSAIEAGLRHLKAEAERRAQAQGSA
jgi:hypothetical protein